MKKYTFMVYHKEYDDFLNQLCDLGMVHISQKQEGTAVDHETLKEQLSRHQRIAQMLTQLEKLAPKAIDTASSDADGIAIVEKIEAAREERDKCNQQILSIQKEISQYDPWGDFSWNNVAKLENEGWKVGFYSCSQRNFKAEWEEQYCATTITHTPLALFFVTLTKEAPEDIEADVVKLPVKSFAQLSEEKVKLEEQYTRLCNRYETIATQHYKQLQLAEKRLAEKISFSNVRLSTTRVAEDRLLIIEGWLPEAKANEANDMFSRSGVLYETEEPKPNDGTPVKLNNGWFARMFEIITNLYDLPRYGTLDLTPLFAPFFVMFFGMCFADLGYGILLLTIGLVMRKRVKGQMRSIMTLGCFLGISAMIWGFITGNLAGIELLKVDWPFLQWAKPMMLEPTDMFNVAIGVGILQILFGMCVRVYAETTQFGFMYSLRTLGWLILLAGCGGSYGLKTVGMIDDSIATPLTYLFGGIGGILILLLNNPEKKGVKMLLNIPSGLKDVYESLTGLLGDVLSYIRLFALGLSGSVMGIVFNELSMKMSGDIPVVSHIVMLLMLVVFHGMNIFMSILGSFVHPMRLTFVEFYKNANFQGGGKKYKPFERNT